MAQDDNNKNAPESGPRGEDYSTQRLRQRYRFNDPNMDLFFLGALGWGSAGGLSVGEAFHVASQITDGDVNSWVSAFERQGIALNKQADVWQQRGWTRAAGEMRLKAFASYRTSWQFAGRTERFIELYHTHQKLFDQAMTELRLPATSFSVPYGGGQLPGHFYKASDSSAPTVLVIGGADTTHEDRFLSIGRHLFDRGYSVALVDLPGQGLVQDQGLHWEQETERPISAVIDLLISQFGVDTSKLALVGMSLGGYFACRAAAYEHRLAAVIATTPLFRPGELFATAAQTGLEGSKISAPTRKNFEVLMWKAGVSEPEEMLQAWSEVKVDPNLVEVPFLSVLGAQEGAVWAEQAKEWHEAIRSSKKSLVVLDAETGADVHCQGNNTLRLVQEMDGWLHEVLG